jgi:hypothetical protein
MAMHRTLIRGSLLAVLAASLVVGALSPTACAVTVAHWNFETDLIAGTAVNGQVVSHPSATAAFDAAIADISGNGNHLSAFAQNGGFTAMQFSNIVASNAQTNSTLSMENQPGQCCPVLSSQDDLEVGGVNVGAMAQWSIEASVNFKGVAGWQTLVGKDGWQQATNGDINQAPLYLQKKGDGTNQFRINFVDAQGFVHIVDSTTVAGTGGWYHVAATSDGSNLRLYVDGVLENTLDMTLSGSSDRSMAALDEAGFEGAGTTAPYGWSTFRGMYNDGHGDRVDGYMDDVRISNAALAPAQLLYQPQFALRLVVNKNTGAVAIRNISGAPVTFDFYQIDSPAGAPGGALSPTGWNSLSDQNINAGLAADFNSNGQVNAADLTAWRGGFGTGTTKAQGNADGDGDVDGADFLTWQRQLGQTPGEGDSWDEAGGSSNLQLIEAFLNGSSTLAPGAQLALGNAYNPAVFGVGVNGNLTFRYSVPGAGILTAGEVQYVTSGPATPVPEPGTAALGSVMLMFIAAWRRGRN